MLQDVKKVDEMTVFFFEIMPERSKVAAA